MYVRERANADVSLSASASASVSVGVSVDMSESVGVSGSVPCILASLSAVTSCPGNKCLGLSLPLGVIVRVRVR